MTRVRNRVLGAVLSSVLIALAGALPAAAAGPVAITCGAVLRQDAYLAADLTCPTGNGVEVAAPLSIDLRGHHLTGSPTGVGITVDYPATTKVTHGRLTGWGTGLTTVSRTPNPQSVPTSITVIAVTFLHNGIGIAPGEVDANGPTTPSYTVYRSWFVSNDTGLGGVVGNTEVKVSGGTFRNNRVGVSVTGDQLTITGSVTVSDSELRDNKIALVCFRSGCVLDHDGLSDNPTGVLTEDYFTYLAMTGNTVTGSTMAVDLHENLASDLTGNTFTANTTAVAFSNSAGSVRDNVFAGNGTALTMQNAGGGQQYPPIPVTGNRVSNNTGDGILAINSDVELKNNVSTFNQGWGINAPGAVDQGGNRAYGNFRSPQCVGVVCTH